MRRSTPLLLALCLVLAGVAPALANVMHNTSTPPAAQAVPSQASGPAATGAVENETNDTSAGDGTTLTVLSYNDVQTAAAENGTFPRMVTLIERRRAAHDNPTVVVGGGDEVSPHSLSPLTGWRVPTRALNVLDPAAEAVGNHDLDYGFGAVENYSEASEFPWLMANVVDEETGEPIPGTKPYTVVERDGVTVGIVGVADEKIREKTAVDFDEQGYEVKNYSAVAGEYATMLTEEKNVDVVVVSAHLGVPVAKNLARTTENVDAIVVGDDEIEYPPQETGGAVVMEAEARAEHVAELNLTVEDGEVTAWNGRLLNVTEDVPKNETVANVITSARTDTLNEVAGRTTTELDARFASNYHDETALGNTITDAFRAETGAEVAVTNAGGIRSNAVYGPGNVTVGDVYNILPFSNTLVTVELTGAELKRLLASQVVTLESEAGQRYGPESKLQVSGVTYEWVGHEGGPAVRDVWVNGEPLDADETYTVTVNSYMAGWEDSVLTNAPVVDRSNTLYGTALLEYVRANSPISPEDENRIRRVDSVVDARSVSVREGTATVALDAPAGANATVDGSFYATPAASGERLAAESVELDDGTMRVRFDADELKRLSGAAGRIQLYGKYDTTAYERVYFDHSVLNANLAAADFGEKRGRDGAPTCEERSNATATASLAGPTPAA